MPTAQATRTDVCVIIVSHDSREWLDAALRTLDEHTGEISLEAIVVDNGADGAGDWAAARHPFVRAVRCENRGFGHANNRGLELADSRFVLFLNPDTEVVAGQIEALVAAMDGMPEVGLAGLRQVRGDDSLAPTMRRFPSVGRALAEALAVERIPPVRRLFGERVLDPSAYERVTDCDWTAGSAMLVRADALTQSGGFDERFFLFSEETDLCRRIKAGGWRIVHLPDVTVRHHEGAHWTNPRLAAQMAYARLQFARKNLRHPGAYRAALLLRFGLKTLVGALPRRRGDRRRLRADRAAFLAVLRDRAPFD